MQQIRRLSTAGERHLPFFLPASCTVRAAGQDGSLVNLGAPGLSGSSCKLPTADQGGAPAVLLSNLINTCKALD